MKKYFAVLLGIMVLGLGGCMSMNIAGAGSLGDVGLGGNVDPINGTVGVDAGKSVRVGNTETSVGASSNGSSTNVNTNTQVDANNGE